MKYQIQAENGRLKRVTVELAVADAEPLVQIQHELMAKLPDFKPKEADDLHMTLFHFGEPQQLFLEVQKLNPKLEFEHFLPWLYELLEQSERVVAEPLTVKLAGLEKFGNHNEPVLALTIEDEEQIRHAHHEVGEHFVSFLRACGIEKIVTFMQDSYLKNQLDNHFRPHISLGRLPQDGPLPALDVAGQRVQLTRSRLRNVMVQDEAGEWSYSR